MKNIVYYIPYSFLIFILTFSIIFSFEYWPITNFAVFRTPKRLVLDQLEIYFWYYFDNKEIRWVRIPRRNSHTHDSFSFSLSELLAQKKSKDEVENYIRSYLTGELKVQGILKKAIRVKVVRKKLDYRSKFGKKNKECFQLGEQGYCVYEEILTEIVI